MFTKKITESDAFLEMPASAQNLYFHLNMEADDDGFVNAPKKIMRMVGSSEDDMRLLILKKFVLVFDSGVIVIKHWRMHNLIKSDRYHPTQYQEEYASLWYDKSDNIYHLAVTEETEKQLEPKWNQNGTQMEPEVRLGQDSLVKVSLGKGLFAPHDDTSEAVYNLKLKEKDLYQSIYREDIDFLQSLYPGLDVEQQIRSMVGWCISNTTKRKTKSGIASFITRWLNTEQNKLGRVPTEMDELSRKSKEAYIKDVERKLEMDKRKDEPLFK